MSVHPAKFREAVLLCLFALQTLEQSEEGLLGSIMYQLKLPRSKVKEAVGKASLIQKSSASLVADLEKLCNHYRWSRLGRIEQAVLTLASWELKFEKEQLPYQVILAEATRLAKKFSSLESAQFVNAVLQAFYDGAKLGENLSWQDPLVDHVRQSLDEGAQIEKVVSDHDLTELN